MKFKSVEVFLLIGCFVAVLDRTEGKGKGPSGKGKGPTRTNNRTKDKPKGKGMSFILILKITFEKLLLLFGK